MSVAGVDVPSTFAHLLKSEPDVATAVAAIKTLILVLEKCSATTLQELIELLKNATKEMKDKVDCSACSVQSGCELFLRFITLASQLEEAVRPTMLTFTSLAKLFLFTEFRGHALRDVDQGATLFAEGDDSS